MAHHQLCWQRFRCLQISTRGNNAGFVARWVEQYWSMTRGRGDAETRGSSGQMGSMSSPYAVHTHPNTRVSSLRRRKETASGTGTSNHASTGDSLRTRSPEEGGCASVGLSLVRKNAGGRRSPLEHHHLSVSESPFRPVTGRTCVLPSVCGYACSSCAAPGPTGRP